MCLYSKLLNLLFLYFRYLNSHKLKCLVLLQISNILLVLHYLHNFQSHYLMQNLFRYYIRLLLRQQINRHSIKQLRLSHPSKKHRSKRFTAYSCCCRSRYSDRYRLVITCTSVNIYYLCRAIISTDDMLPTTCCS